MNMPALKRLQSNYIKFDQICFILDLWSPGIKSSRARVKGRKEKDHSGLSYLVREVKDLLIGREFKLCKAKRSQINRVVKPEISRLNYIVLNHINHLKFK